MSDLKVDLKEAWITPVANIMKLFQACIFKSVRAIFQLTYAKALSNSLCLFSKTEVLSIEK